MKLVPALLVMAALASATALAGQGRQTAGYPVQLTVLESRITIQGGSLHGSGRGRIRTAGRVNGIDFTYACGARLAVSYNSETYAARWAKYPGELTVLTAGAGGEPDRCALKVHVHHFLYVTENGRLTTISQQQWAERHAGGVEDAAGDDPPPEAPRTDDSTVIHPN